MENFGGVRLTDILTILGGEITVILAHGCALEYHASVQNRREKFILEMRRVVGFSLFCSLLPLAHAWGAESHKIIAYVAASFLDQDDVTDLQTIMDWNANPQQIYDQLPAIAADGDKEEWSMSYHTANYLQNASGDVSLQCINNQCIWTGMTNWTSAAVSQGSSDDLRQEAIKFIVHLMGDVFQPLHVGREADNRGVQIYKVWKKYSWPAYGKGYYSLHQLWDSGLFYYLEVQNMLADPSSSSTEEEIVDSWEFGYKGNWKNFAKDLIKTLKSDPSRSEGECLALSPGRINANDPQEVEHLMKRFAKRTAKAARDFAYLDEAGNAVVSFKRVSEAYMKSRSKIMKRRMMRAGAELACFLREVLAAYRINTATTTTSTTTEEPATTTKKKLKIKVIKKATEAPADEYEDMLVERLGKKLSLGKKSV